MEIVVFFAIDINITSEQEYLPANKIMFMEHHLGRVRIHVCLFRDEISLSSE